MQWLFELSDRLIFRSEFGIYDSSATLALSKPSRTVFESKVFEWEGTHGSLALRGPAVRGGLSTSH
jgi:hypothetical protein